MSKFWEWICGKLDKAPEYSDPNSADAEWIWNRTDQVFKGGRNLKRTTWILHDGKPYAASSYRYEYQEWGDG